ncbi:amino acid ABC transporter permease [Pseudomonadota bacterium]
MPYFNNPKIRAIFIQSLIVIIFALFFLYINENITHNLHKRGIKSGFDFLGTQAGFDIIMSIIPYDSTSTYGRVFVVGLLNTILVSVAGIFFATILGFLAGIGSLSNNWLIHKLSVVYVNIFRNVPLLLQIMFWYFLLISTLPEVKNTIILGEIFYFNTQGILTPKLIFGNNFLFVFIVFILSIFIVISLNRVNKRFDKKFSKRIPLFWIDILIIIFLPILAFLVLDSPVSLKHPQLGSFRYSGGFKIIPEFLALCFALTIYTGAYISEQVRAGILSVSYGQIEAAKTIGLNKFMILRFVTIPQAMKVITPPLISQYLNLIKNSSLAATIGYPDLVSIFMGTTLNQSGQAIEIVFITMCVYLSLSLLTSAFLNWYNKKIVEREKR